MFLRWDGCLSSCKHCGEGFPEISDVRTHIYHEHTTEEEREGLRNGVVAITKNVISDQV